METDNPLFKALLVSQGNLGNEKNFLVDNRTNISQKHIKVIISMAGTKYFKIWSHDLSQTYVQFLKSLERMIYFRPWKEPNLCSDYRLLLLRPLYGLPDDYWDRSMSSQVEKYLKMKTCISVRALYLTCDTNGNIIGLLGYFADEIILCVNEQFLVESDQSFKNIWL